MRLALSIHPFHSPRSLSLLYSALLSLPAASPCLLAGSPGPPHTPMQHLPSCAAADLEFIRQPLNDLGHLMGATLAEFSCNATDMGFLDLFVVHWLCLPVLLLCLAAALGIALLLAKSRPAKYGPDYASNAKAKAISLANFFMYVYHTPDSAPSLLCRSLYPRHHRHHRRVIAPHWDGFCARSLPAAGFCSTQGSAFAGEFIAVG